MFNKNCETSITEEELHNHFEELSSVNQMLQMEKDFTSGILDNAGMFIIIWDINGSLLKFNKYSQDVTGFREEEVLGKKWMDVLIDKDSRFTDGYQ